MTNAFQVLVARVSSRYRKKQHISPRNILFRRMLSISFRIHRIGITYNIAKWGGFEQTVYQDDILVELMFFS